MNFSIIIFYSHVFYFIVNSDLGYRQKHCEENTELLPQNSLFSPTIKNLLVRCNQKIRLDDSKVVFYVQLVWTVWSQCKCFKNALKSSIELVRSISVISWKDVWTETIGSKSVMILLKSLKPSWKPGERTGLQRISKELLFALTTALSSSEIHTLGF